MESTSVRLPFVNIDKIKLPFVEGSFVGNDEKVNNGFFLVDGGSTKNILNFRAVKHIGDDCITDIEEHIGAISNVGEMCKTARINITVGDVNDTVDFSISHNIDFRKMFGPGVIGILGVEFLCKHRWVLDFDSRCLRHVGEDVDFDNLSFFFPMEFGLKNYTIPAVGMIKGEEEFVFIVDSGCNVNTMTQYGIDNATEVVEILEERNSMEGIFGVEDVSLAKVRFSMLSVGREKGKLDLKEDSDIFQVLSDKQYIMEFAEKDIPPVVGMISSDFMLRHKWTLDFHYGIMYASNVMDNK